MRDTVDTVQNKTEKVPTLKEIVVQLGKTDHKHITEEMKGSTFKYR